MYDEECYGANTVCQEFRCTCPTNFEEFDIDEKKTICRLGKISYFFLIIIKLAPDKIGDNCQRDCKPPLICRENKCECWGGTIVDGKCIVSMFFYYLKTLNNINFKPVLRENN